MTDQTPAQRMIGDFAPKLVELTDDVLFGDVWARPWLAPRDVRHHRGQRSVRRAWRRPVSGTWTDDELRRIGDATELQIVGTITGPQPRR